MPQEQTVSRQGLLELIAITTATEAVRDAIERSRSEGRAVSLGLTFHATEDGVRVEMNLDRHLETPDTT